jgi:hypothetical protein
MPQELRPSRECVAFIALDVHPHETDTCRIDRPIVDERIERRRCHELLERGVRIRRKPVVLRADAADVEQGDTALG